MNPLDVITDREQVRDFVETLEQLLARHRPSALILLQFEKEEIDAKDIQEYLMRSLLEAWPTYLKGVELLVRALEVAYVSDRRSIEDRLLLLPPPQSHKRVGS